MALHCPVCIRVLSIALVAVASIHTDNLSEQASHEITASGALIGMESRRATVMRSNPWPPLQADAEDADDVISYLKEDNLDSTQQTPVVQSTETVQQVQLRSVSTSLGVMLIGMVAFIMSIFYATHYPDPDIRHTTWLTLSETISLFSAVLLFATFKEIMVYQFGELGGHHDSIPDLKSLIISFVRMLVLFWAMQGVLLKYRFTDVPLKAWASIGGNVVAFGAIDAFAMIQQVPPFRDNPANTFLGCVIAAFLIGCMCVSAHIVRDWIMTYDDGIVKEHEKNWNEHCKQLENRFASLTIGLLLSVVFRYAISGTVPATWGSPRNKTQGQVDQLFGVALGLAFPVFGTSMGVWALDQYRVSLPAVHRAATVIQLCFSMTMGWSLAFVGQWEFWSATDGKGIALGDKMTARMVDALAFSYLSFGFVIALDYLADRMEVARTGFAAVSNAFVLGLGLSWQGCFTEAITSMAANFQDPATRCYMDALMTLSICGVVLPAWVMYMLPRVLAGPEKGDDKTKGEGTAEGEGAGEAAGEDGQQAEEAAGGEKCPSCAADFEEGAQFCSNCGYKKPEEQPEAPEPEAPEAPVVASSSSVSGGKGGGKAAASGGKGGGRGSIKESADDAGQEAQQPQQQEAF